MPKESNNTLAEFWDAIPFMIKQEVLDCNRGNNKAPKFTIATLSFIELTDRNFCGACLSNLESFRRQKQKLDAEAKAKVA